MSDEGLIQRMCETWINGNGLGRDKMYALLALVRRHDEAELAALRADAARMDFLERCHWINVQPDDSGLALYDDHGWEGLRAAIDAMQAAP